MNEWMYELASQESPKAGDNAFDTALSQHSHGNTGDAINTLLSIEESSSDYPLAQGLLSVLKGRLTTSTAITTTTSKRVSLTTL
jgi:hypothetical protein